MQHKPKSNQQYRINNTKKSHKCVYFTESTRSVLYHESNGSEGDIELLSLRAELGSGLQTKWQTPPWHKRQEVCDYKLQTLERHPNQVLSETPQSL